jgi:hypothetical protein
VPSLPASGGRDLHQQRTPLVRRSSPAPSSGAGAINGVGVAAGSAPSQRAMTSSSPAIAGSRIHASQVPGQRELLKSPTGRATR